MSFEKQNQIIYNSQSENISIILSWWELEKKKLKKKQAKFMKCTKMLVTESPFILVWIWLVEKVMQVFRPKWGKNKEIMDYFWLPL